MTMAVKSEAVITTNVPSDSVAVYSQTATYAQNAIVQYEEKIYTSLADNNVGILPTQDVTKWYFEYPTNKMAMFDAYVNTVTTHTADIEVTLGVSDVDVLALFGCVGESVTVSLQNNVTLDTLFTQEIPLLEYSITDWWEWTYLKPRTKKDVFVQLPILLYDATIHITIKVTSGVASCAHMTWGLAENLGCTQWGATVARRSNISKERKANGYVYLQKGISWKRMTVPVKLDTGLVDVIERQLADIDGVPTLFIGDDVGAFESLLVFGFYRDFEIALGVSRSSYNLEIEGIG